MLKLLCNVLLGAILGAVHMVYLKLAKYVHRAAGVDGIKSQWLCKKSATLCTLYYLEMRIPVERIYEIGDEVRE